MFTWVNKHNRLSIIGIAQNHERNDKFVQIIRLYLYVLKSESMNYYYWNILSTVGLKFALKDSTLTQLYNNSFGLTLVSINDQTLPFVDQVIFSYNLKTVFGLIVQSLLLTYAFLYLDILSLYWLAKVYKLYLVTETSDSPPPRKAVVRPLPDSKLRLTPREQAVMVDWKWILSKHQIPLYWSVLTS